MRGATDVQLRVTMDASQAKAEAERLHREISRRYRTPTAEDALRLGWDKVTGMPPNPHNPDLPYAHARHSGIWWANHGMHKNLGNSEYRHQFFTEREAKYMGLQFAKQANKEFKAGAKDFAIAIGTYALHTGLNAYYGWAMLPGKNNRAKQIEQGTTSGALSGLTTGASAIGSLLGLAAILGAPVSGGLSLGLLGLGAGAGAAIGAAGGYNQSKIDHRNEDEILNINRRLDLMSVKSSRETSRRNMAFQKMLSLTPHRESQLDLFDKQLRTIREGDLGLRDLEKRKDAMINGRRYKGRKYEKGDWNTEDGQRIAALLSQRRGEYESIRSQRLQLWMNKPHANPMDAITDSYSQRGLFVGGQVNVQKTNTIIVDKMKVIINLLEKIRSSKNSDYLTTDKFNNLY